MKTERSPAFNLTVTSTAHALNDLYSNFLPQLLPFLLVLMPGFTVTQAAILVAAFNLTSSLFQPIFGFMVDGKGRSWLIYVGTIWMAIFLSLTGLVHSWGLMVLLAGVAGLGTAAFHPPASSLVNGLSSSHKAMFQSIFVSSGNVGFALAPLLLVPLFKAFGLGASVFLLIPGVLTAALLYFSLPKLRANSGKSYELASVWKAITKAKKELSVILGVIALRSAAYTGLLALLPLYFHHKGLGESATGWLMGLMLLTGALGGLVGGWFSDRWGRKPLIAGSLMLATPLFLGFVMTTGWLSVVLLALGGGALLANFSVTIIAAQETIPDHKAMAAGLSLGFANGIGALAVVGIGSLGDLWGVTVAVVMLVSLPVLAGILGLFLKNRSSDRQNRLLNRS